MSGKTKEEQEAQDSEYLASAAEAWERLDSVLDEEQRQRVFFQTEYLKGEFVVDRQFVLGMLKQMQLVTDTFGAMNNPLPPGGVLGMTAYGARLAWELLNEGTMTA